jgi:Rha family phage regulatory protein
MNDLVIDFGVTERKSVPIVSSRKVAEVFEKEHKDVLESIRNLIAEISATNFSSLNFIESNYKVRGKKYPEYLMTKDGFTLLTFGYGGKKAIQFKIAYINRFNEMESFIKNLLEAKAEFPEFTDAIMSAHEEPKHYHYSNEINMINSIVLGMPAKKFKEVHNIKDVKTIRPYLTTEQIEMIKALQRIDIGLIISIKDFQERKMILQEYFNKLQLRLKSA